MIRTFSTLSLLAAGAAAFGQITAVQVATNLNLPTGFYASPTEAGVGYATEKGGTLSRIQGGAASTVMSFAGLTDSDGERGFLGLAFDPHFSTNNRLYSAYVDNATKALRVVRTNGFDASSAQTIIEVPHPTTASNHYGGTIRFGGDGMLYVSMGDGGGANDPENDAQNLDNWLGKILRIDVSGSGPGYAPAAGNPFLGSATQEAIWAYGLRNPFKYSFDTNGDLYIGDVGQGAREEIDRIGQTEGGVNFGWPGWEGTIPGPTGSVSGDRKPIYDYDRSLGGTVIGGVVYHGTSLGAAYSGRYFFGDFLAGKLWSIDPTATDIRASLQDHSSWLPAGIDLVSIDAGAGGELYLTGIGFGEPGSVYKLQAVPEPGSMVALAIGALVLSRRREPRRP